MTATPKRSGISSPSPSLGPCFLSAPVSERVPCSARFLEFFYQQVRFSVTCLSHGDSLGRGRHPCFGRRVEGSGSRHTLTTTMSEAVNRSWTILPEADSDDSQTSWYHESASPSGRRGQQPPEPSKQGGGGSPCFHSPPKVVNVSVSNV